ncbi:MAG: xanthine dehydrogenase family protein molybdopterin-binding subunit [bacterium]
MSQESSLPRLFRRPTVFASDLTAPGMLHAVTLRSTRPRGSFGELPRLRVPSDIYLFGADDLPGANAVVVGGGSHPVLAPGTVSYVGQPIAVLAGPDIRRVHESLDLLQPEYEDEEPVLDEDSDTAEIAGERFAERGDPDGEVRDAFQIIQGTYRTGPQEHLYSEPQAVFATPEGTESVTVYTSTQWPHHVQRSVAQALDTPVKRVRVIATETGVHLDGKLWIPSLISVHAAFAAVRTGRPVKLVYTRQEDFRFTSKRAPVRIRYTTALGSNGELRALVAFIRVNVGAFPVYLDELLDRLVISATGDYRCDNIRVHAVALKTNLPPFDALSGLGSAQAFFACESHTTRVAEVAEQSPLSWKAVHLLRKGDTHPLGGKEQEDREAYKLLDRVDEASDFSRKHAAFELQKKRRTAFLGTAEEQRGIGIAFASQGSGFVGRGEDEISVSVRIRLDQEGVATVYNSAVSEGESLHTIWAGRIAEALNLSREDVRFADTDTAEVPDSGPSFLSRNITVITRALDLACAALRKRRFRDPLPIEVSRSYRIPRTLTWNRRTVSGKPFGNLSRAAAVIEVSANPSTLETHVRGIWLAVFAGNILDPNGARKKLEMSVYQAMGWAASEALDYQSGVLAPHAYEQYAPDLWSQYPPISIDFVGDLEKLPSLGLEELPFNCVPAAYAAAVTQATGHYIDRIPATPALLRSYLEEE